MEPQAPYEKEDAQSIIANYLNDWVEWRDDGLFIRQDFTENDVTGSFFQWTPACDMEWDGAPDPKTAPSLPFPFTASQLAAFMLNGIGSIVASAYGTWEDGPGEADMDEVMNVRARKAREALRKAFSLYRDAEKAVGELAPEVRDESRSMHPAILRVQGRKSELQATLKHLSWCRAMTRQLLHPQATTPSPEPAPQAAPVVAVIASGGVVTAKAAQVRPLQRTSAQDNAIICEIQKQGYDPLALPKNPKGKPGVKAIIRAALSDNELFVGSTIFNKAWERLAASADIVIKK
ncbi:MAG: hypothetical protein NTZ64_18155 [Polaromonas sp.]|nr:hypothetical protein [Polaromonas sp.]